MLGAGTIINPLIKVVTTVAILAAVYFFIVKPTLDTTESAFEAVSPAFEQIEGVPRGIEKSLQQAERLQQNAAEASSSQLREANRLIECINRADSDVDEIQRCNKRFSP